MNGRILIGDCREALRTLDAESVQCVVTSPPYYGLRDYGVDGQIGLEARPDCLGWATGDACGECFVCVQVAVFREVRRVLRTDGTCWVNLGDSYAGARGGAQGQPGQCADRTAAKQRCRERNSDRMPDGFKAKDLMGMPWRVALALQADGWWLRQDIIWSKPNPMPESIKDRCTKAHEYLFLLTKSERYYFDADAIKEQSVAGFTASGVGFGHGTEEKPRYKMPDGWATHAGGHGSFHREGREKGRPARDTFKRDGSKREQPIPGQSVGTHRPDRAESEFDPGRRNKRSVWTVATQPFKEAHFATFPEALIEPCILAGSRPGDAVLDPFIGAGTTAVVCERLGRQWIGCELNPEYASMAERRIHAVQPGIVFSGVQNGR